MFIAAWIYLHFYFPPLWFYKYPVYNATGGIVCGCLMNSVLDAFCLLFLIIPRGFFCAVTVIACISMDHRKKLP